MPTKKLLLIIITVACPNSKMEAADTTRRKKAGFLMTFPSAVKPAEAF